MKKNFYFFKMFFVVCIFLFVATLCFYNNTLVALCSKIFVNAASSQAEYTETVYESDLIFKDNTNLKNSQVGSGEHPLVITNIIATNKIYDGNTNIEISIEISGVVGGDDVYVTALANTLDKNAGKKKYVEVTDFVICGEDASNYYLSTDHSVVLVDIYKKSVDLIWHTSQDPLSYEYNGNDQKDDVYPYFLEEGPSSSFLVHRLSYSISGYSLYNGSVFNNEFKNAGEYTASVILMPDDLNYDILYNGQPNTQFSLQLKMNRILPEFILSENNNFVYTGRLQDASGLVSVNNVEQSIIYTGNKFTTVSEGNSLQMKVSVQESLNYFAQEKTYRNFINVAKATDFINIENVKKEYTYNGQVQRINSGATISNQEQCDLLTYDDNGGFIGVNDGNALEVLIYAQETENYKYTYVTFRINVNKKAIDTSGWQWSSSTLVYNGGSQEIKIKNINESLITPFYIDNIKTEAGIYCAKVSFQVLDTENYLQVTYPDKIWKIEKKVVAKPSAEDKISEYCADFQTLNIQAQNSNYNVFNNIQKNAGRYLVTIRLNDSKNYVWNDGTSEDINVNWTITKKKLQTPKYNSVLYYNGKQQTISVLENDLYFLIANNQKEVGEYSSYLVLTDVDNYEWEDGSEAALKINWKISFNEKYNASTPIIAILFAIILIVLLALPVTLHFTNVIKRRRKKRVSSSNSNNNIEVESIQKDLKEASALKENSTTKDIAVTKNSPRKEVKGEKVNGASSSKTRKTRMVSMKKVDKKNRRIKELKIKNRVPAKRGRPPKKKTKKTKK